MLNAKSKIISWFFRESLYILWGHGAIGLEQDESFQNWLAIQDWQNWAVVDVKFIRK